MSDPFDAREYWEERLARIEGLGGVGEIGLGQTYNRWMYRVRASAFRRYVRPLARRCAADSVIDVGAGTGFYIDQWQKVGIPRITGIDITDVAVTGLRRRFPSAEFVRADVSDPNPPNVEPATIVSAFDVLFHVVDDTGFENALSNLAALTTPGGFVVITDVFQQSESFTSRHQVGRTLQHFTRALDRAGLDVQLRRPVFVLMADPTDSTSRALRFAYTGITRIVRQGALAAGAAGAILYPVELLASRFAREGPSIELLIAQKRP